MYTINSYDLQGIDDDLDGVENNLMGVSDDDLGAVFNSRLAKKGLPAMNPAQTKSAVQVTKQVAVKSIEKANKGNTYTRTQRFLNANINALDADTKEELLKGNLQNQDTEFYLRRKLAAGAGAIIPLLETSSVRKCGVTNFDKAHLPNLMNFVLGRVRLGYYFAKSAAENEGDGIYMNSFNPGTPGSIPAAILNGELEIQQNGAPIVSMPIRRFFNLSAMPMSNGVGGASDTVQLEALKLIKAGQPIDISIRLAEGVALPVGNHMFEVCLTGVATRRRGVNQ